MWPEISALLQTKAASPAATALVVEPNGKKSSSNTYTLDLRLLRPLVSRRTTKRPVCPAKGRVMGAADGGQSRRRVRNLAVTLVRETRRLHRVRLIVLCSFCFLRTKSESSSP